MLAIYDRGRIRAILETDRNWAAYALADLEPGYCEHSRWFVIGTSEPAIVLIYSAFSIPVVLAVGAGRHCAAILNEIASLLSEMAEIYFVIRPDLLLCVEQEYSIKNRRPMLRMVLDPENFSPTNAGQAVRLGLEDQADLTALYRDGERSGDAPDFFSPSMLNYATYFGVHDKNQLVAAGGTHVYAPGEGVAGLGNIYTRKDYRGQGWGSCVTSAVTQNLLAKNLSTIALNVNATNAAAIRLYQRLGFRSYCRYFEIIASPKADSSWLSHSAARRGSPSSPR